MAALRFTAFALQAELAISRAAAIGFDYCNRRFSPFIASTRVLISSIDSSVASR